MLRVQCVGNIDRQALVFFHGFLGCGAEMNSLMYLLSEEFFCLSIDMPGHGKSPFSENFEKEYEITLASIPLKDPIAVGYSMGGRVVMRLLKGNIRFTRAIFLSAHPGLAIEKEKREQSLRENLWIEKLQQGDIPSFLMDWYAQPLFSSLRSKPSLLEKILQEKNDQDTKGLLSCFHLMRLSQQTMFETNEIPCTFFHGSDDEKYKHLYREKKWNVDVVEIPESGHAVHRENPQECARQIRKIIA